MFNKTAILNNIRATNDNAAFTEAHVLLKDHIKTLKTSTKKEIEDVKNQAIEEAGVLTESGNSEKVSESEAEVTEEPTIETMPEAKYRMTVAAAKYARNEPE